MIKFGASDTIIWVFLPSIGKIFHRNMVEFDFGNLNMSVIKPDHEFGLSYFR